MIHGIQGRIVLLLAFLLLIGKLTGSLSSLSDTGSHNITRDIYYENYANLIYQNQKQLRTMEMYRQNTTI